MHAETQLNDLLSLWESRRQAGDSLTPEDLCRDCPELLGELRRHVQVLEAMHSRLESAPAQLEPSSLPTEIRTATRYRVVRHFAEGGLGEVLLARDEHLGRNVALKLIKRPLDQRPERRQRFLREAEITSRLEHPGIVPIYGFGEDESGRPCYAMRFIQGETLKEAIGHFHGAAVAGQEGSASLEFRRLLTRFIGVCNAVAYAHSQGVVHRDLKPANIMLGGYGESLVVDWGLAKQLEIADGKVRMPAGAAPNAPAASTDAGVAETADHFGVPAVGVPALAGEATNSLKQGLQQASGQPGTNGSPAETGETPGLRGSDTEPGAAMGTPVYMSPEQAAGQWSKVAAASDIYSLGGTLFTLLTNRLPVEGKSATEVLEKVCAGAILTPRQVYSATPAALDAVCRKAMALRAVDRYGSALALAADLEQWLADEPVSVYREPLRIRAARWVRRHKTAMTGAVTLLATAVVGLAGAAAFVSRQNSVLHEKNQELVASNLREAAARQKADEHFKLSVDAVDKYLKRVGESPDLKARGLAGLRRDLLDTARDFFARFVAERGDDPSLLVELGNAQGNLGYLASESGARHAAIDYYRKMLATYTQLARDLPANAEYQKRLAVAQWNLGYNLKAIGEIREAEGSYRQALRLFEQLTQAEPESAGYRRRLGATHNYLAQLYEDNNESERAIPEFRQAVQILEALDSRQRGDPETEQQLANSYSDLGLMLEHIGESGEASDYALKAVAIRESLVRTDPANLDHQRAAAVSYGNLGLAYSRGDQRELAAEALGRAVAMYEQLLRRRPWVADYQADLAGSYGNLAIFYAQTRRAEEAQSAFQKAVDIREQLVQEYPEVIDYAADLGGAYSNLGQAVNTAGNHATALELYEKAIRTLDAVLERDSRHTRGRRFLGFACFGSATTLAGLGRHAKALANWDRGLAVCDAADQPAIRLKRVETLARLGMHREAAAEATALAALAKNPASHYRLACVFALSSASAGRDTALSEADRSRVAEEQAVRAVQLLLRAKSAGHFHNPDTLQSLKNDRDLECLRSREDFRSFLEDVAP